MVYFNRVLHQKERNVDIRYHTESQGLRIQLFCTPKNRQSMPPKRFALRMSRDFAYFLFKLRNAGAYIPKETPCTIHVSTNLIIKASRDFLSRTHVS